MKLLYFINNSFRQGTAVPPHSHNCFEFIFNKSCKTKINYSLKEDNNSSKSFEFSKRFNELPNSIDCEPTSFILIPPKIVHNEHHLSDGTVVAIGFLATEETEIITNNISTIKKYSGYFELPKLIDEIENEISSHDNYSEQLLNALVTKLLISSFRKVQKEDSSDNKIGYAKEYIDQYYLVQIDISKLAKHFNYSESHFRLLFKKINGISIGKYITNKRIDFIKENLVNKDIPIKEISSQLPFCDYYSFSAFFKKHTGYYPKEYREIFKAD
jgi:AraC-like DNA-binding protein